jgi:hypothetical protein
MTEPKTLGVVCRLVSYLDDRVTFERPGRSPDFPSHSVTIPDSDWAELGRPNWVAAKVWAFDPKEDTDD